jgi:hypothetical protein
MSEAMHVGMLQNKLLHLIRICKLHVTTWLHFSLHRDAIHLRFNRSGKTFYNHGGWHGWPVCSPDLNFLHFLSMGVLENSCLPVKSGNTGFVFRTFGCCNPSKGQSSWADTSHIFVLWTPSKYVYIVGSIRSTIISILLFRVLPSK